MCLNVGLGSTLDLTTLMSCIGVDEKGFKKGQKDVNALSL